MSSPSPAIRRKGTLVTLGLSKSGKSTLLGKLLHVTASLPPSAITAIQHAWSSSSSSSPPSSSSSSPPPSWLVDHTQAEREGGSTLALSPCRLRTSRAELTVFNVPGQSQLLAALLSGVSSARMALVVVSAVPDELDAAVQVGSALRQQLTCAHALGLRTLVVCVNKMDLVDWDQARFAAVRDAVLPFVASLGFQVTDGFSKSSRVVVLPVSGKDGDLLVERTEAAAWYRGPTLVEVLETIRQPKREKERFFRLPIQDAQRLNDTTYRISGTVAAGVVAVGEELCFAPGLASGKVALIRHHEREVDMALAGDYVRIKLEQVQYGTSLLPGVVAGDSTHPPHSVDAFEAHIVIVRLMGVLPAGTTVTIDCHTAHMQCTLARILQRVDVESGDALHPLDGDESAAEDDDGKGPLTAGEAAIVEFDPITPLSLERFTDSPRLGRLVVRDGTTVIGVGVVTQVHAHHT